MQETAPDRLLPLLVERLRTGTDLRTLVSAAALANARTFGGEDYVGFHVAMALAPAWRMARESPEESRALPVLKVLHRNTSRIREFGGREREVLRAVEPAAPPEDGGRDVVRDAVRAKDLAGAERALASLAARSPGDALNGLLGAVGDHVEVHRVVLPARAWDLLDVVGPEHAYTLLRQSLHYCVRGSSDPKVQAALERAFGSGGLSGRSPGTALPDDDWVEATSAELFASTPDEAADLAASALAEGTAATAVGEAIALAANQLVLRDAGRSAQEARPGKPAGSVHGDSIGVHACDSARAWRTLSGAGDARNALACLVLGAYQVARDRTGRGGEFLAWRPRPLPEDLERVEASEPAVLLREADAAIRDGDQARAAAVVQRSGQLGHAPEPWFDLLLRHATEQDGALHAEKYYATAREEFASTRPAFRWRHLVALARVTASGAGHPAPGLDEARRLLASRAGDGSRRSDDAAGTSR